MMKRRLTFGFLLLFFNASLVFLSGCADLSPQNHAKTNSEPVQVTFAHWATSSASVIDNVFKEYNLNNNSNIVVDIVRVPSDQVDETLKLMLTSGQGPDIYGLDTGNVKLYSDNHWIIDLTQYMDASFLSRFPTYAIESAKNYTSDGKMYTISSIADTYRLIYNRDLFEMADLNPDKPPKTIQEVREYAKKISEAGKEQNKYGFALPASEDWTTFCLAMEYPVSFSGVSIFDRQKGEYNLTALKPWLQFFIDMKNDGSLFPGDVFLTNEAARKQFAEGNVGMMFSGSWDPNVFDSQFPAKCSWDVALPPTIDENSAYKGALITQQGWSWVVNSKVKNQDATIKVWKFLYSDEFLGELFSKGCVLPIVKGINENPKYQPKLKNFDKYFPTEKESSYPGAPLALNEASRFQYYRDIYTGKKTMDEGLKEAGEELNNLLKQTALERSQNSDSYTLPGFDPLNPMKDY